MSTRPQAEGDVLEWVDFLENAHPGSTALVSKAVAEVNSNPVRYELRRPRLRLHCTSCDGIRSFDSMRPDTNVPLTEAEPLANYVLSYYCCDCLQPLKTIAVQLSMRAMSTPNAKLKATKIGEFPPFGQPTPSKVMRLVGPDREMFLKGRRCEFQGLGVGAFSYYRRVVENQKLRILDKIIDVAKRTNAGNDVTDALERAKKETQFSRAVDDVKAAFPPALLVDGHNPLTLLHSALSKGLHAETDEECLQLAQDIRVILFNLVERVESILADETELKGAVSRLLQSGSQSGQQGSGPAVP